MTKFLNPLKIGMLVFGIGSILGGQEQASEELGVLEEFQVTD